MKRYIRSDIYTYTGYATDNFGNSLGKYTLTTEAPSAKRAKTNFQHQIRKRLNRVEHFVVNIAVRRPHKDNVVPFVIAVRHHPIKRF